MPEYVMLSRLSPEAIWAYGHATTETLLATPWKDFLKGL